ncbi:MAG: patatin-like phospholipase family protein [Cytophagaceae bacterium]|nr:patatin-like phospholipase family protein [Cytophagaceae bacterium]
MKILRLVYLIVGLFTVGIAWAQPTAPVRNLVFEGAGVRGIAYVGVLGELENRHVLDSARRVAGTSAGSIVALLVALRYSPEEIGAVLSQTRIHQFNDGRVLFFGGLARMRRQFGWYRGEALSRWLGALVARKTGSPNSTFADLRAGGYRELHVTGTSLMHQKTVVFSEKTFPQMRLRDAVRISCSIPFYFRGVWVDSLGRVFTKPKRKTGLQLVVDGGIAANFPIRIFDDPTYFDGKTGANPETLGIRIDSDAQIGFDEQGKGLAPLPITTFSEYVSAFYNYTLESLNRPLLTPADWSRTVSVSSKGIRPRVRRMSLVEKTALVESGRQSVVRYFEWAAR